MIEDIAQMVKGVKKVYFQPMQTRVAILDPAFKELPQITRKEIGKYRAGKNTEVCGEMRDKEKMKKVIIIGATSGIGRELAKIFSAKGCEVGITGRRTALLEELASELPTKCHSATMDVKNTEEAVKILERVIHEMNGLDMLIISAGTGHINPALDWTLEKETIDTNVSGFTAITDLAMRHFIKQKSGIYGIHKIIKHITCNERFA